MNMDNQRVRLTKRLLKDALITLMHDTPFDRITVKKLCETAGINRTTFYLHYSDTSQLLMESENDIIETAAKMIVGPHSTGNSKENIASYLNYIQQNSLHFRTLFTFNESDEFVRRFSKGIIEEVKPYLSSELSDQRKEYLLQFSLSGSVCIIREWLLSGYKTPVDELAEVLDKLTHAIIFESKL